MSEVLVEQGVVLGFGGSNARRAVSKAGDISKFASVDTPKRPKAFFGWMGRQLLEAADAGAKWVVAGYPGPVSPDGKLIGPFKNIPGLKGARYDLAARLGAVDPAVGRLLASNEFTLVNVNDGNLAAHAATGRIGAFKYSRVASLILGSGVGSGLVIRDPKYSTVYRVDEHIPAEIGHIPLSADPADTFENAVSGTALARIANARGFGEDSRSIPKDHHAWRSTGEMVGQMSTILGFMLGADLVVPCGGIGSGAQSEYDPHLQNMLDAFETYGSATQRLLMPNIMPVPREDRQVFELFGGESVMRDIYTRAA